MLRQWQDQEMVTFPRLTGQRRYSLTGTTELGPPDGNCDRKIQLLSESGVKKRGG